MSHEGSSNRAATRWAVRVIPVFILGALGFATYAVVPHFCINYLYRHKEQHETATALLVLYFVFFTLTLSTYLRTFITIQRNPALVPWSDMRQNAVWEIEDLPKRDREDIEMNRESMPADQDPDSPGLEKFYSKRMFTCQPDGKPRWCALCWGWKPDRAHHSSELGRCVRKMDHVCPWVGGMVSETSFNFFVQFTFYATLFQAVCLGTAGYCLRLQLSEGRGADGRAVALLALAGLFITFTIGMTLTSSKYIFENITNVDMVRKTEQHHIAVRVPIETPSCERYWTITYPLSRPRYDGRGHDLPDRDERAKRTFAVVHARPGENPFDLGPWRNFKSIMGNNPLEWLLPIKHSPCCNHDSMVSDYEFGPIVDRLRREYGIPDDDGNDPPLPSPYGTPRPSDVARHQRWLDNFRPTSSEDTRPVSPSYFNNGEDPPPEFVHDGRERF